MSGLMAFPKSSRVAETRVKSLASGGQYVVYGFVFACLEKREMIGFSTLC